MYHHNLLTPSTLLLLFTTTITFSTAFNPDDTYAINACANGKNAVVCLNGGIQYAICNGQNTITQNVAAGQICRDGKVVLKSNPASTIILTTPKPTTTTTTNRGRRRIRTTTTKPPGPHDAFVSMTTSAPPQASQYCLQGGVLAGEPPKYMPDECESNGPIRCRGQFLYTSCNIGPTYKCSMPGDKSCHMWHNGEWIEA